MNAIKIGEKIRKLRGSESRESFARKIGVSPSALSMYETGKRIPRDEIKLTIAEKTGKSVEDIFFSEIVHN